MPSSRPLVLVVDDDDSVRAAMRELLDDQGYRVAEAADGREALALLEALIELPRLVLLDLAMPVMTGWQLLLALAANRRLARLPVVVVSAEPPSRIPLSGVVCHLRKPVTPRALLATVEEYARPRAVAASHKR
jgi:two-component system, OmpR family, response regulator CpxR